MQRHRHIRIPLQAYIHILTYIGDPLGIELYTYWEEYEALQTTEALICKDIDKFEMIMQAFEYEQEHLQPKPDGVDPEASSLEGNSSPPPSVVNEPLRRFFVSTAGVISSPLFRRLDCELREKREGMLREKGWAVTEGERWKA
jgi:hypothetical protein